ncbi:PP2C family protein-serine/threonine phosphatase [Amycolatopsis sp. lyj-108]|uniref:PP2C family protein-serine/threonine phosphatase n=1 Tax=Amycolatopsis sp. lyj-108 TaxID=2789286 RepID=UPI003978DB27
MHIPRTTSPTQAHPTSAFSAHHHPIWPHTELPTGPRWAHAVCRCGWTDCAESLHDARVLARRHRRTAYTDVFYPGCASRISSRRHQADATAVHVSLNSEDHAWVVADGIGDHPLAADAAAWAAATAARVAARHGAVAGLLSAADALPGLPDEDTVMVVASPLPSTDGAGWDVAWVGDCRAYEYRAETDQCVQLTVDHTRGQKLRTALAASYQGRPDELEAVARRSDHIVTSSVSTATATTIGHVTTSSPRQRLILTSDGVHKPVPLRSITRAARTFTDSRACAHKLTVAARYFGGTDNATAMVIDPAPEDIYP